MQWASDKGGNPYLKSVTILTSSKASKAELTDICFASLVKKMLSVRIITLPNFCLYVS